MRPGQKNRMRGGRGGNNNNNGGSRRGPNPLTRSYESNGPDVKVRGTPQHIAEKYMQLARDAHTSGDIVMAESYLQHAEHYYRIISAAHSAQQVAYNQSMGIQTAASDEAQSDEDEFEVVGADRFTFQAPQPFQQQGQNGGQNGQQPYAPSSGQPYDPSVSGEQPPMGDMPVMEGAQPGYQPNQQPRGDRSFGNRRPFGDRGERQDRGDRPDRGDRQERGDRPERQDRGERSFDRQDRQDRPERQERPEGERQDRGDRHERGPRRFGRDRNFGDRNFGDRNNGEPRSPQGDRGGYAPRQPDAGMQPDLANDSQPILPSFITAPVRVVAPEVMEAPAPRVQESAPAAAADADAGAKVRRRRRVRNADGELVDSTDE
ncbi:MAG: DUF4167 domain-containing protein [Beijerinckiaceae bacterium]